VNEKRAEGPKWDAYSIRNLRRHLEMTQQEMSEELGVRQQTISDWERGYHQPRGGMSRLLSIVAERAGYRYTVTPDTEPSETDPADTAQASQTTESA
jgi:DNA-binding XRE family transcriptional regulator